MEFGKSGIALTKQSLRLNSKTKRNKFKKLLYDYWKYRFLFLILLPVIAHYILFRYVPMYGVLIAFKDYKVKAGILGSPWVGLENFKLIFSGISFYEVFRNTVILSLYNLVFGFPAPIILALLLNEIKSKYFKKVTQTISYLPHFISWVILAGIFMEVLSPSRGPIGFVLQNLGIKPIFFLADVKWFRSTLVATGIWKGIGWGSIIYLATLSNINTELYESAIVDGANRFQRIIYITIPGLMPVVTFNLIFSIGGIIGSDFDQIFNLYNPAVYSVGDVLSTYVYRKGIQDFNYSFATAVGLFLNIISIILVITANKIAKRFSEFGIW